MATFFPGQCVVCRCMCCVGAPGPTGHTGVRGATGATGAKGATGDPGAYGAAGLPGEIDLPLRLMKT